jgi:hypothetical protein
VNHARRDLCGGHPAMGVPTAKTPKTTLFLPGARGLQPRALALTVTDQSKTGQ